MSYSILSSKLFFGKKSVIQPIQLFLGCHYAAQCILAIGWISDESEPLDQKHKYKKGAETLALSLLPRTTPCSQPRTAPLAATSTTHRTVRPCPLPSPASRHPHNPTAAQSPDGQGAAVRGSSGGTTGPGAWIDAGHWQRGQIRHRWPQWPRIRQRHHEGNCWNLVIGSG